MTESLLIFCLLVASFLFGFLRDILIANQFGSGWYADLLFVSLILPVFFENLLGLALRDAMIPFLKNVRSKSATDYSTSIGVFYRWSLFAGIIIAAIVGLGGQLWLPLLAPGWSAQQVSTGVYAFGLGSILISVQTVLYSQTAFLNVEGCFVLPMWRTVLLNIGGILAMLLFPKNVVSILTGMLLTQVILSVVLHFSLPQKYRFFSHNVKGRYDPFIGGFSFVLLATAAQQLCIVAERLFASYLEEGSITLLALAFRVTTIPLTLFALSILTILYPLFSGIDGSSDTITYQALIRKSLKMTLVFLVPAAVLLISKSELVVSVLLERGQFGVEQTLATSPLVVAYAIGLPGFGIALLFGRILISQHLARLFFLSSSLGMVSTIVLDMVLYSNYGALGLASAFSLGGWTQACLCILLVNRKITGSLNTLVFLSWILVGCATFLVLNRITIFYGLGGLLGACVFTLIVCLGLLFMLGEREIFKASFWNLKKTTV